MTDPNTQRDADAILARLEQVFPEPTGPRPPLSRREMWLSIALDIAQGLPEPQGLNVYGNTHIVTIQLPTHADARRWAEHIGAEAGVSSDGSFWAFGDRDGWQWQVRCFARDESAVIVASPTAEQVVAAILAPDMAVLPS